MRARPRAPSTVACLLLVALLVPAGPSRAQSLEAARRDRAAVQQRLDDAADRLADLEARAGALSDEADALAGRVRALVAEADSADARVAARVREAYKRGIDSPLLHLLGGDDPDAAIERAELAGHLLAADRVQVEVAVAARQRAATAREQLVARRADLDGALTEQATVLASLRADLDRAAALEARLVAEEQRRQAEAAARRRAEATATAPVAGGRACPVGQPHAFTDTWGAPRSGGRRHQGVDILDPYGTPVYAIVSGVWDVYAYGRSAGNWAILRGDDGTHYYYMHLQRHVVGDGARVRAGQQTGTVGDTGNATGTPHLHFEVHPGGGGAVNPTPTARAAC